MGPNPLSTGVFESLLLVVGMLGSAALLTTWVCRVREKQVPFGRYVPNRSLIGFLCLAGTNFVLTSGCFVTLVVLMVLIGGPVPIWLLFVLMLPTAFISYGVAHGLFRWTR